MIGESGEAYVYKVEDLNELKDSSFRMYDICTKKKWMYTKQADRASWELGEILWASSGQFMEERFEQRFFYLGTDYYEVSNFISFEISFTCLFICLYIK